MQFHPQSLLEYLGAGETVKGSRVGVGWADTGVKAGVGENSLVSF